MGGIASVYIKPQNMNDEDEEPLSAITKNNDVFNIDIEKIVNNGVEFQLREPPDNEPPSETDLARTIRYLAVENARLAFENQRLKSNWAISNNPDGPPIQPDIYGESLKEKITRLENTLVVERAQKWEAIEKCERLRVDLVNMTTSSELEKSHSVPVESDMEKFRTYLKEKREERQKCLAAKSKEMQNLREDLAREKTHREKLERDIELFHRLQNPIKVDEQFQILQDNDRLRAEILTLKKSLDSLAFMKLDNEKLCNDLKTQEKNTRELKTTILQLQNDIKDLQRKYDRSERDRVEVIGQRERDLKTRLNIEEQLNLMWTEYDNEKAEIKKKTAALKQVLEITREMLSVRENQVRDLKEKLKDIENSLGEKKQLEEHSLKIQYEKQLENIKLLKALYEERMQLMETERSKLHGELADKSKTIENQKEELSDLTMKYEMLAEELDDEKQAHGKLQNEFESMESHSKSLQHELNLINTMFTQMLLGPYNTGTEADLDRLTALLQENHDLIAVMTSREECSEIASALPKLLLDLITRVDAKKQEDNAKIEEKDSMTDSTDTISEKELVLDENITKSPVEYPVVSFRNATLFESEMDLQNKEGALEKNARSEPHQSTAVNPAVQEIASNLPKVWKVLTELLSHHISPEDTQTEGDERQCYKNIETPQGTRSVISVSNTFIRLKNLIIEKKTLQRELSRLKHLNAHLEQRLDDQEKRLSQVHTELHKTWGVVGRMRSQHQQLHNHEKILRYELQEKRLMLSELKQELEYCREKWERARQKNDESETEWRKLRKEFAARKTTAFLDSIVDSGESGFSDEHEADSEGDECSRVQSPIENEPGCSEQNDEARAARLGRLQRLEQQCDLLVRKVDITAHKSNYLANRLEELHDFYGGSVNDEEENTAPPDPPPIPDFVFNLSPTIFHSFYDELACKVHKIRKRNQEKNTNGSIPMPPPMPQLTNLVSKKFSSFYKELSLKKTNKSTPQTSAQSFDERMAARAARLTRLEQQCSTLVGKVANTVERGKILSNRLEEIHEDYTTQERDRQQLESETNGNSDSDHNDEE